MQVPFFQKRQIFLNARGKASSQRELMHGKSWLFVLRTWARLREGDHIPYQPGTFENSYNNAIPHRRAFQASINRRDGSSVGETSGKRGKHMTADVTAKVMDDSQHRPIRTDKKMSSMKHTSMPSRADTPMIF